MQYSSQLYVCVCVCVCVCVYVHVCGGIGVSKYAMY